MTLFGTVYKYTLNREFVKDAELHDNEGWKHNQTVNAEIKG